MLAREGRGSVYDEIRTAGTSASPRHGDLDHADAIRPTLLRGRPDPPKDRSTAMTQNGTVAKGQHPCHPFAFIAQSRVSNGIDTSMYSMKPTRGNALRDPARMQAGAGQLRRRDYPMLARG
jgi:hypothetical protein